MWRIGVDLGGTKIEALALSPDGREYGRRRILTPRNDYEATLHAILSLIEPLGQSLGGEAIAGIGIGIPGSLSPATGLVRNANSTWLNGKPLLSDLQARIGVPVFIENDANCFALSEATDGAAAGFACVFGVILGTGVGGGVVVNGQTIVGRNAIAGEWGHNPLPWPDGDLPAPQQACFCGRTGCIESVLSGPALESQYLALAKRSAGAKLIAERAAKGDTQSQAVLAAYATRLAKALAPVINVLDPDVVVFGGGISNIPFVIERARAELPRWVFSDCCETEFRVNRWGDSSGVRGAARLPPLPT